MGDAVKLTKAQRRLLRHLADGGCFFAALREPDDFTTDGVVFSEAVGIVVHTPDYIPENRYRVRNKTAGPLYLATPPLVTHFPGDSGWRVFEITPAGLSALTSKEQNNG